MSTLLNLLDAFDELPQATDLRTRSYRDLGDTVVDVGCGGGRAVGELAALGKKAIGVDLDPEMIEVAATRWPAGEFHVGDATALPLDDASVTGYRADKVLHVLADPTPALTEAWRVLRPGGRAVLTGQDWDAIVIDSADPAQTRALVHARADGLPNPRVARQYRNLLLDHGFTGVTVAAHLVVFTGEPALPVLASMAEGPWLDEQAARAARDRVFVAVPVFLAAGTRGG
ncbi:methyltransferase domain-containing protein [Actinophytocola algeriensis]|jgi:ubiquinone/menaquinone biosynthesis C-methylase UbiE|uniref:Ubiquinone/menaquinone biosynthesis C-methylase UbiE n=1 Tax=Actinophytocola algeriensis TaxID=1768010 RepID=A0A7W7VI44_9PSEU|nr:methyltransferase domain-containing protein [Actinophytocola algeriensis]MBB4911172.1 ubiquinone/menaquinone biosynthesis C-methylase UbiE [Actinophytocola algeriensis]MBE1479111.1 ubiquinone/menaquinone biosynthesis C-methylase UbiE [Actinophytocola algeriensis]